MLRTAHSLKGHIALCTHQCSNSNDAMIFERKAKKVNGWNKAYNDFNDFLWGLATSHFIQS